jgi:hypothetical protein
MQISLPVESLLLPLEPDDESLSPLDPDESSVPLLESIVEPVDESSDVPVDVSLFDTEPESSWL